MILDWRTQAGTRPLHRIGFGDNLIDVIAIHALKRAKLEPDAPGLDMCQYHWPQTFGTGVRLTRCTDLIKRDSKGRHDTNPKTGRERYRTLGHR